MNTLTPARIGSAVLAFLVFALPLKTATVQAASVAIVVSGNHLLGSDGQAIVLHGADVSGTEFACAQGWSADAYGGQPLNSVGTYFAMRAWSINVVRVPLNEDCWLGINGVRVGGATYQAAIKSEVGAIHASGMYAILDLHWSAPGGALALAQQPAPDADHSPLFWMDVAGAYKDDPAVIFDLYNEPFLYGSYMQTASQTPWTCWLNGCSLNQYLTGGNPYTQSVPWHSAGMQTLVTAVRAAGAKQPIMVNGLDWANDLSGYLGHIPNDPQHQLIAGWHSYAGEHCGTMTCWDAVVAPIARSSPVLVGETGDSSHGPATFLPGFLPWADQHGISYVAWTWNPWQDATNVLIKDWSGLPTAGEGAFYQQHLLHLAGPVPAAPALSAPHGKSSAQSPPNAGASSIPMVPSAEAPPAEESPVAAVKSDGPVAQLAGLQRREWAVAGGVGVATVLSLLAVLLRMRIRGAPQRRGP